MTKSWLVMLVTGVLACSACDDSESNCEGHTPCVIIDADAGDAGDASDASDAGETADAGDAGGATDPGALIAVSMSSTVGVLLDDFPEAVRDEVAARLLAEDDAFFITRGHRQIQYTWYRLAFRQFFYEEDSKMQLPLPPEGLWQITLAGEPERRTIDGHDLIAADYDFEATILASPDSPEISEPLLAEPSGLWMEPFVFPVDPDLLLQRTGYACANESDFPLGSVDGENAWQFFDHSCEVETADTAFCHLTQLPDQACLDALDTHVGSVETQLAFERLAWDDVLADQVRSGKVTTETGADLEVYLPGLDNHRVTYRYFEADACALAEGCVGGAGWRRLLQFDAISHNVGGGPMHIGDVDYYLEGDGGAVNEHHLYEYSGCHAHYHFNHYGAFYFGDDDEAVGGKRAFCLESTNRLSNNEHTPLWSPYGFCEYQGIEAGWGDMYQAGLDCQWVDVTDVASPVSAKLTSHANPDDLLCEGVPELDDEGMPMWVETELTTEDGEPIDTVACEAFEERAVNNRDSVEATLPAPGEGLITTPCKLGQLGPRRDCDFGTLGGLQSCTPGETTTITCSVPSNAAPAVVRVCEASAVLGAGVACTYLNALANQPVLEADGDLELAFSCPEARDDDEPGGSIALYAAPLLPGDELSDVSCAF